MGLLSSAVSAVLGLGSSGGKDQKACLIIEKEGGGDVTFNCQFNPEEFHINSRGKFTKETRAIHGYHSTGSKIPHVAYATFSPVPAGLIFSFCAVTAFSLNQAHKCLRMQASDALLHLIQP